MLVKAAGALLSAAVLGSHFPRAAGSAYWMASLPVLPALTHLSWLATLRIAWDVSTTVSDEAVEIVKAIGAEARSVAEAASMEARSWVVTFGAPIRGAIYFSAWFLGTFALWLLVSSLRNLWPTWPSPYAHGMRDEQPAAGYMVRKMGTV